MIKEHEYCMSIDNFKRPVVYKNQQAIAVLLTRLILLDPGSDPLHPDMGVGIASYRFSVESGIEDLRMKVSKQIETYLPCFSSPIVDITITPEKLCNIEITIDDVMYVYDSSEAPIPITLDSVKNA